MIAASQKAHREELVARMNQPEDVAPAMPAAPMAPRAPVPAAAAGNPQQPADYWFLNQPTQPTTPIPQDSVTFNTQVVAPGASNAVLPVVAAAPTADEEAFIKQHSTDGPLISPNMHGHLHVIQPLSAQSNDMAQQPLAPAQAAPVSATPIMPDRSATGASPSNTPVPTNPPAAPQQQVTPAPDAGILDLARNDDLNVATIAREAQKRKEAPDEVVISLH
jgi:hypothetical protein